MSELPEVQSQSPMERRPHDGERSVLAAVPLPQVRRSDRDHGEDYRHKEG